MVIGSTISGNILTIHLPPPRRKKGDGSLVHQEIYFKPKNSKATLPTHRTWPLSFMVVPEVDVMNFEQEVDDLVGDDTTMNDGNAENLPTPSAKLKSTIMNGTSRLDDGNHDNTKSSFKKETNGKCNSHFATRK